MDDNPGATDASSQADDRRYPRPLWIRIPRWIASNVLDLFTLVFQDDMPEDFGCFIFLIGLILYPLGIIYNLSALVVHNHNNFGVLLIGTNIVQALPFNQLFPLLLRNWWVVLLSLLALIVVLLAIESLSAWAYNDKTNESKELERRREKLSSPQPDDLRYPRTQWIRKLRWVFISWWLIPTLFLAIYILNAIFSFYSLIAHNGFVALLTFSNIAHTLLFDALGQNWLVVLLSALVMVMVGRGLWSWADEDKTNESKELERRRLNQIEEQEKQQPPGIQLHRTLRWKGKTINQIAWSLDGQAIASATISSEGIQFWDSETGQLIQTFKEGFSSAYTLAWSPDGLILAAVASRSSTYRALTTSRFSTSRSSRIELWDVKTGQLLRSLTGESSDDDSIKGLAWSPDGLILAAVASPYSTYRALTTSRSSTSRSSRIELWDVKTGQLLRSLTGESSTRVKSESVVPYQSRLLRRLPGESSDSIQSLAWSPDGLILAAAQSGTIELWDTKTWQQLRTLKARVNSIAWSPDGQTLASASNQIVLLWDPKTGRQRGSLEGHTAGVLRVAFSCDGRLLASKSSDNTVRLWRTDTWETVAVLNESSSPSFLNPVGLAFHPKIAGVLATLGVEDTVIHIWDLDLSTLFDLSPVLPQVASIQTRSIDSPSEPVARVPISSPRLSPDRDAKDQKAEPIANVPTHPVTPSGSTLPKKPRPQPVAKTSVPTPVRYTNAKVILVGDSGVGKSGLGLVLTDKPFAPTESTHGRFVWTFDSQEVELGRGRKEIRETLLWDLAGQPGYRLIHQLHLNEVTVALVIFDGRSETDPFAGVYHWDRALRQAQRLQDHSALPMKKILVAARMDRGGTGVSAERIRSLVKELGFDDFFETSAKEGRNIPVLADAIRKAIDWATLPWVSSTELFQQIKAFLVAEKKARRLLSSADDLYYTFLRSDPSLARIENLRDQFDTCIELVEKRGLIRRLSFGNLVLLQPEMLDAYASALVNAVRDEPDGLGSITEEQVLAGNFPMPKEQRLKNKQQELLLLIAMVQDLLRYEIALREQADDGPYLVFPSQSTRENPDLPNPEGKAVIFSFEGPVVNVYATLAVRLSHSGLFQKQELWKNAVTYTTRLGGTYGIFLQNSGEGRAELTLFFDKAAREEIRFHFEEYVSAHLQRQALPESIQRRPIFVCPTCSTRLDDVQVTNRRRRGHDWMTCGVCDTKVSILDWEERLAAQPSMIQPMDTAADTARDRAAAQSTLQGKIATRDFDVFLCHNGEDKPAVREVAKQLRERGILPWLDEEQLRPGLLWQRLLEEQIGKIKSAAVFVGERGRGPWQNMELYAFLSQFVNRECPVIPVILTDCKNAPDLPIFLRGMTWVDFRRQEPDPMEQLMWGITGVPVMVGQ